MMTSGTEHISATEFEDWLKEAQPGDRIAYATGMLAASIDWAFQANDPNAVALSRLQETTWRSYADRKTHLVQRRVAPSKCEYIAERAS
jgi:hypothetical protein